MMTSNLDTPNDSPALAPQDEAASSESTFFLSITRQSKWSVLEVIYAPTGQRIFLDSFDLNSFRARSDFVRNLLEAVEIFLGTTFSGESHKTITLALQARLLRAATESDLMVYEPIDELNHLAPLAS